LTELQPFLNATNETSARLTELQPVTVTVLEPNVDLSLHSFEIVLNQANTESLQHCSEASTQFDNLILQDDSTFVCPTNNGDLNFQNASTNSFEENPQQSFASVQEEQFFNTLQDEVSLQTTLNFDFDTKLLHYESYTECDGDQPTILENASNASTTKPKVSDKDRCKEKGKRMKNKLLKLN